jgi:hypothetical protein
MLLEVVVLSITIAYVFSVLGRARGLFEALRYAAHRLVVRVATAAPLSFEERISLIAQAKAFVGRRNLATSAPVRCRELEVLVEIAEPRLSSGVVSATVWAAAEAEVWAGAGELSLQAIRAAFQEQAHLLQRQASSSALARPHAARRDAATQGEELAQRLASLSTGGRTAVSRAPGSLTEAFLFEADLSSLAPTPSQVIFIVARSATCCAITLFESSGTKRIYANEAEVCELRELFGEGEECVVCLSAPSTISLLPCGHNCLCQECAGQIVKCPICRLDIASTLRAVQGGEGGEEQGGGRAASETASTRASSESDQDDDQGGTPLVRMSSSAPPLPPRDSV